MGDPSGGIAVKRGLRASVKRNPADAANDAEQRRAVLAAKAGPRLSGRAP